jgi:hypothetical protein
MISAFFGSGFLTNFGAILGLLSGRVFCYKLLIISLLPGEEKPSKLPLVVAGLSCVGFDYWRLFLSILADFLPKTCQKHSNDSRRRKTGLDKSCHKTA